LKHTWAILDKKEKKQFVGLTALDIIISIADILSLALLLYIIRFYIQGDNQDNLSFLPSWLTEKNSIWLISLFFLLFGIKNLVAWFIAKAWYRFVGQVAVRISGNNLSGYQHSGFAEFVNTDSSVHVRRIGFQPFEFSQYILSGIPQIITQASLILLTITAIILFNAKLFLLLLIILLPPVVVIFYFIRNRLAKIRDRIKEGHEGSFQYLLDALKGYVEGNIYGRNDFFLRRFINSRKTFSASLFESISIQAMPPRIIEVFAVLGLFILIIIAKWYGNNDTDYLVIIGAFVGAAYKIIPGIVKIINISGQMNAYQFSVLDLMSNDTTSKKKQNENTGQATELSSMALEKVSFSYDQQPLLNKLSFGIEKGDFVGITGESGKGKSTLLNLLLGFLTPAEGTIHINGTSTQKENMKQYWPFIAYVKQESFLINDTILRNITLEEDNYDKKNLHNAVEISGIDKIIAGSADGLNKIITENGKNISGGQRQRIAIARALYKKARLIILDEPFNELDEESECMLLQHFKQLAKDGSMILLITHNKKSLSFCNKIISLDE
jgi:ABC-type multidrug transport system fused ATPase/permease subunit